MAPNILHDPSVVLMTLCSPHDPCIIFMTRVVLMTLRNPPNPGVVLMTLCSPYDPSVVILYHSYPPDPS